MSSHIQRELLAVYRDLGAEERARVDAHTAQCPPCAKGLAQLQQAEAALRRLPEVPTPMGLLRPLPVVVQPRAAQQRAAQPQRTGGLVAPAPRLVFMRLLGPAMLGLLIIVGLWIALSSGDRTRSVATATPTSTLTPTATLVTQLDELPGSAGGEWAAGSLYAAAPPPVPLPVPGAKPAALSRPADLFFVVLAPRATIVR